MTILINSADYFCIPIMYFGWEQDKILYVQLYTRQLSKINEYKKNPQVFPVYTHIRYI